MTTTITADTDAIGIRPLAGVPTSIHPIIPGFHPDPSICRVGDDFYIANSSFEYSPAVPIWKSSDLVTWHLIGNALDRSDQFLPGHAASSQGVYAPTLRHHDGRFWLITTDVSGTGGQLLSTAEDAAGPWSVASHLPELQGIDPDIAWTPDGTCYVTYCSTQPGRTGIAQARIDPSRAVVLEEPRLLWQGTGLAFPEAPHLYYREGQWYLIIAEGGTERGHGASIARSDSPEGPFVGAPINPFFSHRSSSHAVQNTGHADLVELADGTWAMVYLGVRPRGTTPMFHVNGRETFLAGIDWVDGWPRVDENRFASEEVDRSFSDRFDAERLNPRWVSPGASLQDVVRRAAGGGVSVSPVVAASGLVSMLSVRVQNERWRFESDVDAGDGALALRVRMDEDHWCELRMGEGVIASWARIGPIETMIGDTLPVGDTATLIIEAAEATHGGPDDLRLGARIDGVETELARIDGRYLSTEVAGGFTGRVVGLRALDGPANIREVRYRALSPS